jgi:hypothetical protein
MKKDGKFFPKLSRDGFRKSRRKKGVTRVTEELAEVFDLDPKTIRNHAEAGEVLGVERDRNRWIFSERPGFEGAVPGEPRRFLAPPAAQGVYPEIISGAISSRFFVGSLRTGVKTSTVELSGAVSGVWVRVTYSPSAPSDTPPYD